MKNQIFVILTFFVSLLPCLLCARIISDNSVVDTNFYVMNYGAQGNGQVDDSQAFLKAWQDACSSSEGVPTLIIPGGKIFLLQPISFKGPCNTDTININLEGTIIAPNKVEDWKWPTNNISKKHTWIQFSQVNGLVMYGSGKIDGQGAPWWPCKNCPRPTALHFHKCQNLKLMGLTHMNSPMGHISINNCNGSEISNLHIIAPEESPNTDGIDVSNLSNLIIKNSTMETGDDCIAINGGSSFINISSIFCGPGHGISIGSLGKNGAYDAVEEIHVRNCTFKGSTNGARIKTWKGGSGYARRITFDDIQIDGAKNPIIINQQYHDPINNENNNAVKVSDVSYSNVFGTSASEDAIQLNCDAIGCSNIRLEGVNITSSTSQDKLYASCENAQGSCTSCIPIVPCLKNN